MDRRSLTPRSPLVRVTEDRTRAGRYAAQRRAGFAGLRFIAGLEREYREYRAPLARQRLMTLAFVASFGVFAYLLVDRLSPQPMLTVRSVALLLAAVGVIVLMMFSIRRARTAQKQDLVVAVGITAFGLLLVAALLTAAPGLPFGSLLVMLVAVYFVAGLPTRKAVICALLISAAYVHGVLTTTEAAPAATLFNFLFLLLTNALGLLGEYQIEYEARRTFLLQMELRDLAQHDGMTRLLNRRTFRRQLQVLWRQATRDQRSIGLMLIDLDRLKQINDGHGHLGGDRALRALAAVMRRSVHRPLDICGRLGGDEFAVALYDTDGEGFRQIAEDIRRGAADAAEPHSRMPRFTVSVGGVRVWPHGGIGVGEALRLADMRLYRVKNDGRNGVSLSSYPVAEAAVA